VSGLPTGWEFSKLDDVATWGSGGTPSRTKPEYFGGDIPWVTISDLTDSLVVDSNESISKTGLENSAAKLAPTGSILIALYGSIGKLGIAAKPLTTNQAIAYAAPDDRSYDSKYLFHYLMRCRQDLVLLGTGVTQKNIYIKDLKSFQIPLAPRLEQTRIVARLEELLSDLDAGVTELKAAQKKLGQYRQSLLKAAVDGSLSAEWRKNNPASETGAQLLERILKERRARWEAKQLAKFKEQGKTPPKDWQKKYPEPVQADMTDLPALPEGWSWATIDQLTIEQKYGSSAKTNEDDSGVPVLRMGNIQDGRIDFANLKYLPQDHAEFPTLYLEDGDLLFNRTNSPELVGKTAVFRSETTPCSYASYLIAVRFSKCFTPELASTYINSAYGRNWVKSVVVQQVGQANVNGTKLAALAVPLPPTEEQAEIFSTLTAQLTTEFEQEANITRSLKQAAAQRQNILRAAFAGQLVPQDPNDEPASVLLERIRAERPAQAKLKTRGRKKVAA